MQYQELIRAGKSTALELFESGKAPALESVVGYEFNGCNLFAASKLLGIRKFRKGFFETTSNRYAGYNIPIRPNADSGPWEAKPSEQSPKHFGFYTLKEVQAGARESLHNDALILNYGEGGNPWYDPSQFLRDYLRQPFANNPDILIGFAYIALGRRRVFSNAFVLERYGPVTYKGPRILAKPQD